MPRDLLPFPIVQGFSASGAIFCHCQPQCSTSSQIHPLLQFGRKRIYTYILLELSTLTKIHDLIFSLKQNDRGCAMLQLPSPTYLIAHHLIVVHSHSGSGLLNNATSLAATGIRKKNISCPIRVVPFMGSLHIPTDVYLILAIHICHRHVCMHRIMHNRKLPVLTRKQQLQKQELLGPGVLRSWACLRLQSRHSLAHRKPSQ